MVRQAPALRHLCLSLYRPRSVVSDPVAQLRQRMVGLRESIGSAALSVVNMQATARAMRWVVGHWAESLLLSRHYAPAPLLAEQVEATLAGAQGEWAIEIAETSHPKDYRPVAYAASLAADRGDMRDAMARYAYLANTVRRGAFALLRSATLPGIAPHVAERRLRLAVETYPTFALARRAHAQLVRTRDPVEASTLFGDILDHQPALNYGEKEAVEAKRPWVELEMYQGFHLLYFRSERRYAAYAKLFGLPDIPSAEGRGGPWQWFFALFLVKAFQDKIWKGGGDDTGMAARAAPETSPVPAAARSTSPSLLGRVAGWLLGGSLGLVRAWFRAHLFYFQYSLVSNDLAELRARIDDIDQQWLGKEARG